MPLRHVCWLLLAVVAGTAIGFKIGLPGSGAAVSASPSSVQAEAAAGLAFAPATARRPVKPVGLYTGREAPAGLQRISGVEAASTVAADAPAADGSAVSYSAPYARDLTFMAFPAGATVPTAETPADTTGSTTTTTPSVPSGPPPEISDVRTIALTPFSATLAWSTSEAATSRAVYGLDVPVVWTAPTASGTTHQVTLSGLAPASSYHLDVTATTSDGRSGVSQFMLTTPAPFAPVHVSTADGAILVDGQPSFPKLVWNQCPDAVSGNLAVGVDFFMGNGCGSSAQLATWLSGSAYAIGDAKESATARAGTIGTFLPDEWDTHLPNNLTAADAARLIPPSPGSGPRFLTLTNHFYSRAAPLPQGRGMYPALAAAADVLGFDLYPLQNWCRFDSFGDVFDSQLDPTPETLRAEAWLSIAGGAHAIGYFPNNWNASVGAEIAEVDHEISTLVPALVEPAIAASASLGSTVKVGARAHNGAAYVIVVNASRAPASATITVPALVDRTLVTLDGQFKATAKDGAFDVSLAPLEARIYIAAPSA